MTFSSIPGNPWFRSVRLARYVPGSAMTAHQHDDASLCLVVGGCYEERIRGRVADHGAGHLLFCPAFEQHAQRFSADGAVKILIAPAPPALEYLDQGLRLAEAPYMQSVEIAALGARLVAELHKDDEFSPLVIQGLMLETLGAFARDAADRAGRVAPWLHEARAFVEAQSGATFSLTALARALGRHPVHVSREFRRVYGQGVGDYARGLRVRRAAGLLLSSRRPLSEIAQECGFCDQAHFARSFKAVFKMTPGAYRRGAR